MVFLQQTTSIPIPTIYAIFHIPHPEENDNHQIYLVMERIEGETLRSVWPKMDQTTKEIVVSKLRPIFEGIRQLTSPGGYCIVGHGGLSDDVFWSNEPNNPFTGPFDTESDLNEAMVKNSFLGDHRKHSADFYLHTYGKVLQDHPPTFSHGDIQRKNILIKYVERNKTEMEIVVLDWETAGWYPSYWDYARAMYCSAREDEDWHIWIEKLLKPYLNEFAWHYLLLQQFHGC